MKRILSPYFRHPIVTHARTAFAALCFLCASVSSYAISISAGGTTITFDALPAVADFSSISIAGGGNTYLDNTSIDAAAQALTAAGVNSVLGSSASVNPF